MKHTATHLSAQQQLPELGKEATALAFLLCSTAAVPRDVAALLALGNSLRADQATRSLLAILPTVEAADNEDDSTGTPVLRGIGKAWSRLGCEGISAPRPLAIALHRSTLPYGFEMDRLQAAAAGLLNNAPLVLQWAAANKSCDALALLLTAVEFFVEVDNTDAAVLCLRHARTLMDEQLPDQRRSAPDPSGLLFACAKRGNLLVLRAVANRMSELGREVPFAQLAAAAAKYDQPKVLRFVADKEPGVLHRAEERSGLFPLHVAAMEKSLGALQVLLDIGCNVDVVSRDGYSPLYFAVDEGFDEGVNLLLQRKACPQIGPSALCSGGLQGMAVELGHLICAEHLGRLAR